MNIVPEEFLELRQGWKEASIDMSVEPGVVIDQGSSFLFSRNNILYTYVELRIHGSFSCPSCCWRIP